MLKFYCFQEIIINLIDSEINLNNQPLSSLRTVCNKIPKIILNKICQDNEVKLHNPLSYKINYGNHEIIMSFPGVIINYIP